MASLWTPEGEHRVTPDDPSGAPPGGSPPGASRGPGSDVDDPDTFADERDAEAAQREIAMLERELLNAPVESIIANHCYGMFQLAALHLSQQPPHLDDARLAIDAFAAVVDALGDRFGDPAETMRDALAQIRLAFVQISAAQPSGNGADAAETAADTPSDPQES